MTQNFHVFAIYRRPEIDNDVISGMAVDNVMVILGQTVFEIFEGLIS